VRSGPAATSVVSIGSWPIETTFVVARDECRLCPSWVVEATFVASRRLAPAPTQRAVDVRQLEPHDASNCLDVSSAR
jgi:hypothetical protein